MVFTYRSLLAKYRAPRIKISVSEPPGVNYSTAHPWNCSCVLLGPLYSNRQSLFVFLFLQYQILKLLPWFKKFWCHLCCVSCKTNSSNHEDFNNYGPTTFEILSTSICCHLLQINFIFNNNNNKGQPKMRIVLFHRMNNAFLMKPFHFSILKSIAQVFLPITFFVLGGHLPAFVDNVKIQERKKSNT